MSVINPLRATLFCPIYVPEGLTQITAFSPINAGETPVIPGKSHFKGC